MREGAQEVWGSTVSSLSCFSALRIEINGNTGTSRSTTQNLTLAKTGRTKMNDMNTW